MKVNVKGSNGAKASLKRSKAKQGFIRKIRNKDPEQLKQFIDKEIIADDTVKEVLYYLLLG